MPFVRSLLLTPFFFFSLPVGWMHRATRSGGLFPHFLDHICGVFLSSSSSVSFEGTGFFLEP